MVDLFDLVDMFEHRPLQFATWYCVHHPHPSTDTMIDYIRSKLSTSCIDAFSRPVQATEECPICLELQRVCVKLDCGHNFCRECIVEWMHISNTCPLCKKNYISLMSSSSTSNTM